MSSDRPITAFEVYVCKDASWSLQFVGDGEGEGRRYCRNAFTNPGVTGVRLVRSVTSAITGLCSENLILERSRQPRTEEPSLGAINEVPLCETLNDLLSTRARFSLSRLFHDWIEMHESGVLECLVTPQRLDQLMDRGSLVERAVHQVAGLQTNNPKAAADRRNALLALVDDAKRTSQLLRRRVESLRVRTIDDLAGILNSEATGSGRLNESDAAVALVAMDHQTRLAKTLMLIAVLEKVGNPRGQAVIDRWLSDYVADPSVCAELVPQNRYRVDQLLSILRLARNDISAEVNPSDGMRKVAAGIETGVLTETRDALVFAFELAIRNPAPLSDGTSIAEKTSILKLLSQCAEYKAGFLGGPRVASRLTARFADGLAEGGARGFTEALETIVFGLKTCPLQLNYLFCLLSGSEVGRVRRKILEQIDGVLRLYGSLDSYFKALKFHSQVIEAGDGLVSLVDCSDVGPKTAATWCSAIEDAVTEAMKRL